MTRLLTKYEINILEKKCKDWSFADNVINGLIRLGNGNDHEITALLPIEILMNNDIDKITSIHVIKYNDKCPCCKTRNINTVKGLCHICFDYW